MSFADTRWIEQMQQQGRERRAAVDKSLSEMDRNMLLIAVAAAVAAYLLAQKSTMGYRVAWAGAAGLAGYVAASNYYGERRNKLLLESGQITTMANNGTPTPSSELNWYNMIT